ncbi:hypothetical protein BBOMB_0135 [Bifidobacterium bombi DSM 19703]|uniref:Uncharacterized protein n=1 Tax=Bifidobacterium bombi DSM 19703 TaxID=1341695 RepID=A0A080N1V2_9BIFI|nr:hypothetical protein BBOMB_0135 [Bifidobacterium bombi DSM 19703]
MRELSLSEFPLRELSSRKLPSPRGLVRRMMSSMFTGSMMYPEPGTRLICSACTKASKPVG